MQIKLRNFVLAPIFALPDGAAVVPPRPLSAIAATRAGAVPQARIRQVIAEMMAPLTRLHAAECIHGGISTDTIGLAEGGHAHLLVPAVAAPRSAGDTALRDGRATGFNAFEQYTDDPDWAVGPWTDIYALSAVACSLVSGTVPPSAIDRCVRDDYVPLTKRAIVGYETAFLAAIDAGLSMAPTARPQSMAAFAGSLGIAPAPVAAQEPAVNAAVAGGRAAVTAAPRPHKPPPPAPWVAPRVQAPDATEHARTPSSSAGRGRFLVILFLLLGGWACVYFFKVGLPVDPAMTGNAMADVAMRSTAADPPSNAPAAPPSPTGLPGAPASASPSGAPAAADVLGTPGAPGASGAPASSNSADVQGAPGLAAPGVSLATVGPADNALASQPAMPSAPVEKPPVVPVAVAVNVQPWGEIFVNGASRGVSPPLRQLRLAPGQYTITIRNTTGTPFTTRLTVQAGRPASIAHVFQ